ncbi:E2/UBC family protein [Marinomonas sp. BSi20584]|uniref:E2/UBC family protein n=1 Tax=Marinomonas sp. BSi20584 TaxID=1594462 RepID=UPI0018E0E168|nr:E2/UBC family protein [Marinomonas sp. BSi20584]
MSKDNIHQILLSCGFRYTSARHIPQTSPLCKYDKSEGFYVKDYKPLGKVFRIALSIQDDPHIKLPTAYIIELPEEYKDVLMPHVNFGWYLCYVEQMEGDWDSNNLSATYNDVDQQIMSTLCNSVQSLANGLSARDPEMEGEFASYWVYEKEAYLLTVPPPLKGLARLTCQSIELKNKQDLSPQDREWIIYSDIEKDGVASWMTQRNLEITEENYYVDSAYFKITPVSLEAESWPPEGLKQFFSWLSSVDPNGCRRILKYLSNKPHTKKHMLLLEIENQDIIGVLVELNLGALSLNSHKNNFKQRRLLSALSSKTATKSFERFKITKTDKDTILHRNMPRSRSGNLNKKRIALIGCGTIGGYTAELLLRSGAGCEGGCFHLFDADSFGAHNFGRHCLTTANIGSNKASAVAASLNSSTHINKEIHGFAFNFPVESSILREYDIIIDATGRPPISKRLAAVVRKIKKDERPLLIHGFNDGNGRASKVLIDDGNSCYGCLISTPSLYKNNLDLRFQSLVQQAERFISCGSSYTPYDASVSIVTAALIQEAVLNSLETTLPWTYNEHMFDGSRSRKSRLLPPHINCTICHE